MKPIPIYVLSTVITCRSCVTEASHTDGRFYSRLEAATGSRYRPLNVSQLPHLYEIVHIVRQDRVDFCPTCIPQPGVYRNPTGAIDPLADSADPLSLPPLTIDEL